MSIPPLIRAPKHSLKAPQAAYEEGHWLLTIRHGTRDKKRS